MAFDAAMWNTLKDILDRETKLLAAQQETNRLLDQLIQVMQGQPRQWHPPAPPWQEPAR